MKKTIKAWVVLTRKGKIMKILYSEKGVCRAIDWFGHERVEDCVISYTLPSKAKKNK